MTYKLVKFGKTYKWIGFCDNCQLPNPPKTVNVTIDNGETQIFKFRIQDVVRRLSKGTVRGWRKGDDIIGEGYCNCVDNDSVYVGFDPTYPGRIIFGVKVI